MVAKFLSFSSFFVFFLASSMSAEAIGATSETVTLPMAPQAIVSHVANRAKVEVAIRRIKSLLIVEKGQNDATFEAYTAAQKDLQGRR
jgi:hypothetical protein